MACGSAPPPCPCSHGVWHSLVMPVFPEGSAGSTGLLAVRVWGELNPALPGLGAQVHPENWEQGEKSSLASPGVAWEHDLETRPEFKDSQETMALKTIFF